LDAGELLVEPAAKPFRVVADRKMGSEANPGLQDANRLQIEGLNSRLAQPLVHFGHLIGNRRITGPRDLDRLHAAFSPRTIARWILDDRVGNIN
jgi:hypothetical protein